MRDHFDRLFEELEEIAAVYAEPVPTPQVRYLPVVHNPFIYCISAGNIGRWVRYLPWGGTGRRYGTLHSTRFSYGIGSFPVPVPTGGI
jgi:hypothetical protein